MALQKEYETSSGITANYHKIGKINYEKESGAYFEVEIYLNESARRDNKKPLETRTFYSENINVDEPLVTQLYNYLKTLPEYEGAQDA